MFDKKAMLRGLLVVIGVFLVSCSDTEKSEAPSEYEITVSEDQEIVKYNRYVKVANDGSDFGAHLAEHVRYFQARLRNGQELAHYSVESPSRIKRVREALDKALAIPVPLLELDKAAEDLSLALRQIEPLTRELDNYAQSNGFLADEGKKAREIDPRYVIGMQRVAAAEAEFFSGIQKRDDIYTLAAFERAPRDSVEYFRMGIVLYSKRSARLADDLFQSEGEEHAARTFDDSLNEVAEMAERWEKQIRKARPDGCTGMMRSVNSVLARGRTAIRNARKGRYKRQRSSAIDQSEMDAKAFSEAYNEMIKGINRNQC
ncbi:DUF3829 domain-containing protein [Brucella pituitosa]|uniref:DUF3829 domain-containing protein n=1 Tax=Brucella pituitosa TaxID=571256 RepID=UPI0009A1BF85|nr:DUF3829 domain-containing protein [Brucella pituitosa]